MLEDDTIEKRDGQLQNLPREDGVLQQWRMAEQSSEGMRLGIKPWEVDPDDL